MGIDLRGRVRLAAALVVGLALVLSACGARFEDDGSGGLSGGPSLVSTTTLPDLPEGPGPAPGVTDDSIKIGYLLPLTGAAPIPSRFDKGVNSYWDYVNEQGGIHGRKVQVVIEDTESSAEVGKDKAKKLIEEDEVFLIVVLDRNENQDALARYLNEREFPTISVQAPANPPPEQIWNFVVSIDHGVQGKLIADYMVNVLGYDKVGVVYENVPQLAVPVKSFADEAEKLGAEVTFSRAIEGQATDFLNEALALSESGAQGVWLYMAPLPAAKIANQSNDAGFHPVWFASSISWGFDLVFVVGPESLAGARAFSPWVALSDPRTAAYKEQYRKLYEGEEPDDLGVVGWGIGQIVAEGLREAGADLGQNGFREAMQNLKFEPDIWVPIDFTGNVRVGAHEVAVLAEDGGRWVTEEDFTGEFSASD